MKKAPKFLKQYFWDIDFEKLDIKTHSRDVLRRLLEHGNDKAVKWMKKNFTRNDISWVLGNLRGISARSANFWALIFEIDRKNILCLRESSLITRNTHWPY